MLVALHGTKEEWYLPVQDALVRSIESLGHEVLVWYGRRQMPKRCEYLIWWGCNIDADLARRGRLTRAKIIYLERGWTMDRNSCCQLDLRGTGGLASWAQTPLEWEPSSRLQLRSDGDLLVVLRYERPDGRPVDNVQKLSPYFRDNRAWVEHIHETCRLPVRLRPHPETQRNANLPLRRLANLWGWEWDTNPDFVSASQTAKAVAVLDSTAGVWSLELGLPVLCFGTQVYRHGGVVYCLDSNCVKTRLAMTELNRNRCSLNTGAITALLDRVRAKQWYAKDEDTFPERLRREFGL